MNKIKLLIILTISVFSIFSGCKKKDKFLETIGACPQVLATNPTNSATGVPLGQVITITFNEKMNPATITQESITLTGSVVPGTVSYAGLVATFTPTSPLIANHTYTGRVKSTVKDLNGNALQTDYVWTFSTGATISPMVISTDPADKDSNVVLNKTVTATFNIPMNPLTINATSFTLKQGVNNIAGVVSYNGTTASFNPTALLIANTVYTGTITTAAKNPAGTSIASNYVWTFKTGLLVAPIVISTDPANKDTNVTITKIITATFNMPMNPATISATTFTLKEGLNAVSGAVSYTGTTASFNPSSNLLSGTVYTATITTGAKNLAGTSLANNYVWTFTTAMGSFPKVISTDPANNDTNVAITKIITATFNMPMNPATISTTTFTLKEGLNTVLGAVSYLGTTASFNPSSNLLSGIVYTATITTGAKNVAGTSIASNYVWTFTTAQGPKVISTDPADKDSNVVLNKTITANFNMAMDAATISNSTFTLKLGTTSVSGTVSYSGTTATFNPSANLLSDSTYTATITTGAKNVAGIPLANDYVWTFSTKTHTGPKAPDLKTVARFGIIAGTAVSNNAGFSVINDLDVGISPGARSSLTGFPPAKVVNGSIYAADDAAPIPAMLTQAKKDLTDAYLFAEGATSPAPTTVSGDQGGKTLAPGIYKSTSTLLVQSGDLTLDAKGDVNAVWIFQVASGFTTIGGAGGSIILSGGAQAKNIYWQTGSSATIGDNTKFYGTILALTSITMNSNAVATGRMLARNAAVVMTSTNIINKP